jgi:hypothetical protein
MRDEKTGCEPFIGLICSTFDPSRLSMKSLHKWFHCISYNDSGNLPFTVNIPFEVKVSVRASKVEMSRHFENSELSAKLISALQLKSYVLDKDSSTRPAENPLAVEVELSAVLPNEEAPLNGTSIL